MGGWPEWMTDARCLRVITGGMTLLAEEPAVYFLAAASLLLIVTGVGNPSRRRVGAG